MKLPDSFDRADLELSTEATELALELYAMDYDNFNYSRPNAVQPEPEAVAR